MSQPAVLSCLPDPASDRFLVQFEERPSARLRLFCILHCPVSVRGGTDDWYARVAEIALLVADEHQGRGAGTKLADHLHGYAAA